MTFSPTITGGSAISYAWSGAVATSTSNASFQPTTPGVYTEWLTVTDGLGRTASGSCSVSVQQSTGTALTILTSTTLPYGTAGTPYSTTLQASGGTAPYTWSFPIASPPPPGLTLNGTGVLSGTPTSAGTYSFYANVSDSAGHGASSQFTITINPGAPQSGIQVSQAFPNFTGGYPGGAHQFTFHFTDPLGPADISGGQILFNTDITGPGGTPACSVDWYVNGNVDITGTSYGNFGSGLLTGTYCSLYLGNSSLTQTPQGYDVSIDIGFTDAVLNTVLPAWTRGITQNGVLSSLAPVGAYSLNTPTASSLKAHFILPGGTSPEGEPYCGGGIEFGGLLSRYSDGTLAASLIARTYDVGAAAGWQNSRNNGHLYSTSAEIAYNFGASPTTIDAEPSLLPIPASGETGPGHPGGNYSVVGDFWFTNPNCIILLEDGAPGYSDGNTAVFEGFSEDASVSGTAVDPTPHIDSITLNPPLISGSSSLATITGENFGARAGTLAFSSSDISYTLSPSPGVSNRVVLRRNPSHAERLCQCGRHLHGSGGIGRRG